MQSKELAAELVQKLPTVALASFVATLGAHVDAAAAADFAPPPVQERKATAPATMEFQGQVRESCAAHLTELATLVLCCSLSRPT